MRAQVCKILTSYNESISHPLITIVLVLNSSLKKEKKKSTPNDHLSHSMKSY